MAACSGSLWSISLPVDVGRTSVGVTISGDRRNTGLDVRVLDVRVLDVRVLDVRVLDVRTGRPRPGRPRPVRQEEPTFRHPLDERRRRLAEPPPLRLRGRRVVERGNLRRGIEDRSAQRRRWTDQFDVGQRLHPLETRPSRLHRRRQLARVALVDDRIIRLRHHLHAYTISSRPHRHQVRVRVMLP